jgi:hypothetical protein
MRQNDPSRLRLTLAGALLLMAMIIWSICYLATTAIADKSTILVLLGGGFSAGCAAIFGLLRRN